MSSDEYEKMVSRLVAKIRGHLPALGDGAIAFGSTNRIEGASGYLHQIDVSVNGRTVLFLVECKYWKRSVDTVGMLAFCARNVDIKAKVGTEKKVLAALATTIGFDPGAEQLAKFFGVELWAVGNEQEFVCRVENALSVGLADHVSVSDRAEVTISRGRASN